MPHIQLVSGFVWSDHAPTNNRKFKISSRKKQAALWDERHATGLDAEGRKLPRETVNNRPDGVEEPPLALIMNDCTWEQTGSYQHYPCNFGGMPSQRFWRAVTSHYHNQHNWLLEPESVFRYIFLILSWKEQVRFVEWYTSGNELFFTS